MSQREEYTPTPGQEYAYLHGWLKGTLQRLDKLASTKTPAKELRAEIRRATASAKKEAARCGHAWDAAE